MTYRSEVLADNPYIYLPLEGSVATNLGSKTGMTATSGSVSWGTTPLYTEGTNQVLFFTGSNPYVQYTVGTENLFNSGIWTIEAWIKKGSLTTWANIVHREEGTNKVAFRVDAPGSTYGDKVTCEIRNAAGTSTVVGPTLTDQNWHHVVVTSDGSAMRLYFDGVFYASADTRTLSFTNSTWRLGAYGTGSGNENWFGYMDEVALFKTNLSGDRVKTHYNTAMGITPPPASTSFMGWGIPL